MQIDLSIINLIMEASLLVKLVMLVLVLASLWSWTIIFSKRFAMRRARRAADSFEDRFWSAEDLSTLYSRITGRGHEPSGLERIFEAGFWGFWRFGKGGGGGSRGIPEGGPRLVGGGPNPGKGKMGARLCLFASGGSGRSC